MPATISPPASIDEARAACQKQLGAELCREALERFRLVAAHSAWEDSLAAWRGVVAKLEDLGRHFPSLNVNARKPDVGDRHTEFVGALTRWIKAGRILKDIARHLEAQTAQSTPEPGEDGEHSLEGAVKRAVRSAKAGPEKILEAETNQISDLLVHLDKRIALRNARQGKPPPKKEGRGRLAVHVFGAQIAAMLDIASGRAVLPTDEDAWDRLCERWAKALQRARRRASEPLTMERVARTMARGAELQKTRLPPRHPIVAALFKQFETDMPSEEELLFWSADAEGGTGAPE